MADFPAKSKEKIDVTFCATTGEDLKVFSNPQQPLDSRETGDERLNAAPGRGGVVFHSIISPPFCLKIPNRDLQSSLFNRIIYRFSKG